ncbi:hypothetical protein HFO33_32655 [Rhizobium leguminosarum]|uniref:hypothetical protein n=1 Tax=Rhizobium leguminosarum TaxID=384 RepID=UPI001C96AF17|nr:hypothetical protein [Rhizobium leguminosarum]MBY5721252.1 hypothetical protein [Rhizobium leguminosarum]
MFFLTTESSALSKDRQRTFEVSVGGKHERMIVRQFYDRSEDFICPPSRCNGTVDESSEIQMERVLASEEAIRIVVWHIRRVYFVHLMNLSRSKKHVNTPKGRCRIDVKANLSGPCRQAGQKNGKS